MSQRSDFDKMMEKKYTQENYIPLSNMNKLPNRTEYDLKDRGLYCQGCNKSNTIYENYIPLSVLNSSDFRTIYDVRELTMYNKLALRKPDFLR